VTVVFFSRLRRLVEWFQAPGEGFRAPGARLAAGEELSERSEVSAGSWLV
jgi:hypothetical protein